MNVVYVTGNPDKAKYFGRMVGLPIPHQKADVPELQSMDLEEIIRHKAEGAYAQLGVPVLVEDTALGLPAMNGFPGPFIKWILETVGNEGVCKLADQFDPQKRRVIAYSTIAYYDGTTIEIFKGSLAGSIPKEPMGESGFGWNRVLIPDGQPLTLGQMDETTFEHYYKQVKPFDQVRAFLDSKTQ